MDKELADAIKHAGSVKEIYERHFNNPDAGLTGWHPVAEGGANFKTHTLVRVSVGRYQFRAVKGMTVTFICIILFCHIFILGGIIQMINARAFNIDNFMIFLLGSVFAGIAFLIWRCMSSPRTFDIGTGYYWKGRKDPTLLINPEYRACVKLSEARAFQIISERLSGNRGHYYSYELNLVLADGRRINVVDHGDYEAVKRDASRLSELLTIPVWDAAATG